MPGPAPGRRQPVRGVTSHYQHAHGHPHDDAARYDNPQQTSSSSYPMPWDSPLQRSANSAARPVQPSSSWHSGGAAPVSASERSQAPLRPSEHVRHHRSDVSESGWQRPYSNGQPAPAIAVPIYRGLRTSPSMDLPDSPPSTPPRSPPMTPQTLEDIISRPQRRAALATAGSADHQDADEDDEDDDVRTPLAGMSLRQDAPPQTLIADAAHAILGAQAGIPTSSAIAIGPHRSGSGPAKSLPVPVRGGAGLMPATPEMSPDQEVQHNAVKSAKAFFHAIFANLSEEAHVEDGGVELVCSGWSGAVLKTDPAHDELAAHPAASYGSHSSSSSSSSSTFTKRTLYVRMPSAVDELQLREQVLALLDAASEKLGCSSVMLCLDREMRDFSNVLHGLCYVGGQVVAVGRSASARAGEAGGSSAWSASPGVEAISGASPREGLVLVGIEL